MADETTTEASGIHIVEPQLPHQPDMRVLGFLALGLAVLSAAFALSNFFSPLAYLSGALALFLGVAARGHERSHRLGTAAVVVAVAAAMVATAMLAA